MRPTDLITLAEAATLAERTKPTVREWVKKGHLEGYEGEKPARGGSAPILVSRAAVLSWVGRPDTSTSTPLPTPALPRDPNPSEPDPNLPTPADPHLPQPAELGQPAGPGQQVLELREEISRLKATLAARDEMHAAALKLAAVQAEVKVAELRGEVSTLTAERDAAQRQLADERRAHAAEIERLQAVLQARDDDAKAARALEAARIASTARVAHERDQALAVLKDLAGASMWQRLFWRAPPLEITTTDIKQAD